jgi:alpha-tubulin suppressor-like RCC1 family protein
VSVACGFYHTAVVLEDGALYTFGRGSEGQLGHGDTETQTAPKLVEMQEWVARRIVSVACGSYHTAVVLEDGALYTFGDGDDGRLGHGDTENRPTPTRVALPAAAQSQSLAVIAGVAFSKTYACAWTKEGRIFVWGKDAGLHGELGPSDVAAASATDAAPGAEHASEEATVAPAGAAPLQPREIAGLPQRAERRRCRDSGRGDCVVEVMWGGDHSAYARTERGRVFAWGRGIGGQLGLGSMERDHDMPRLMGPVQGRFVTGVFTAHDDTVYVACGTAKDAAAVIRSEKKTAEAERKAAADELKAQKKLEADVAAAASTVKSNLPESLQGTSQQGWGLSLDAANVKVQV